LSTITLPLEKLKIQYLQNGITASPFKIASETDSLHTRNIIEQDNYTNQNLRTKQLQRKECSVQNPSG